MYKQGGIWRRVRSKVKQLQATAQRHISAIILVVLFLITAMLPSTAQAVKKNSQPQALSRTENLVEQGRALYEKEQFNHAVKILQQAAAAYANSGDKLRQAMTLCNLSLAYQQLGLWTEAEGAIAQALNLLENLENSSQHSFILAQALDVQGRWQLAQGQAETALTNWQRAADIYQQIDDKATLVRNRINSAQALQALGQYRQAEKILTEIQQTLKNLPQDSALKATALLSLGNVLRVVGDLDESRQVLEQSLAVAKALPSNQAVSEALLSLGNTARAQQQIPAALNFYQQAVNASNVSTTTIQTQLNQLSLLLETEQFPAAGALSSQIQPQISKLLPSRMAVYAKINFAQSLKRLKQNHTTEIFPSLDIAQLLAKAVEEAQSLQDKRAESYAQGTLGGLYEQTGQLSDATNLTEKALFIAQTIDASDIAYQWQWQLGRLLKKQRDIKPAIAAYTEAYNSLKSLRSDLAAINPDIQFSFTESVEPVYRELVELLLQTEGNSEPSQDNLKKAREVIESLQLAELDNFFRSACLSPKVEIDNVVDQYQKAAVIYPIILPDRLEVIFKLPDQELRHYKTLIAQEQVESIVENLRKNLLIVDKVSQVKQQSQQFYDSLIRPVEAELAKNGITTLVFVLDGSLRNIPMGVLYDKQQEKYLVEKYAIALTPGLQLLDPKPLQQVRLNALTAGVSEKRLGFSPLPNVPRELKEIQSEIPRSEELLNKEFTPKNLQNELQSAPFSVVHLATHGKFSSDPENTYILTWDELLKVREFDILLRVSDSSRSSSIELLVLSACETAAGDKRAALGLAGIAMRAGARSTLASLWRVDDPYTADLMSEFYRELNTGVTKAEALQRAQLAVFATDKRPYYWAPYVLVGNWL